MTLICRADQTALQNDGNGKPLERKQLSSVSTALLLALGLGIFESLALYLGSGTFLHIIGVSAVCYLPLSLTSLFVLTLDTLSCDVNITDYKSITCLLYPPKVCQL